MALQTRRAMLLGSGALLATGCAYSPKSSSVARKLSPVLVESDRIIRVDVGLRPFRASGFRVEREVIGSKTIVHNYGHGGGGVTLSWGTSKLALDLGYDEGTGVFAVLGSGVVGLSTAQLLLERGARVRIYTQAQVSETTSWVAGAQWWPASVYDAGFVSDEYLDQHIAATRFAFHRFQTLVGDSFGVGWETNYVVADEPILTEPAPKNSPLREFVVAEADLAKHEHPFAAPYVRKFETMMIETPHYLRKLEDSVRRGGAEFVVRSFSHVREIEELPETTVFNCLGLGSGKLFPDPQLKPIRGQLVILRPQPEIDYNVITLGDPYMFGRRDGIVLGGTFQEDDWLLEPREADTIAIIDAHRNIFRGMV